MPPKNKKNRATTAVASPASPKFESLDALKETIRYSCRSLAQIVLDQNRIPASMFECCYNESIKSVDEYNEIVEKAFFHYDIKNKDYPSLSKISYHPNLKFIFLDGTHDMERIYIIYDVYATMYIHRAPLGCLGDLLLYAFTEYSRLRIRRYSPEIGECNLLTDAQDVNDHLSSIMACRAALSTVEPDLWDFNQILRVINDKPSAFKYPTIAPDNWIKKITLCKNSYFRKLVEKFGNITECLGPNMVMVGPAISPALLCGGAAAALRTDSRATAPTCGLLTSQTPDDIHICFVGIDSEKGILQQAYGFILKYFPTHYKIRERVGEIVVSPAASDESRATIRNNPTAIIKLRVHQNINDILYEYPLGIHSFATDGDQLWSTTRGVWSLINKAEIFNPSYDSTLQDEYCRLLFMAHHSGIAIVLPGIKSFPDLFLGKTSNILMLGNLQLKIKNFGKMFAYGSADVVNTAIDVSAAAARYLSAVPADVATSAATATTAIAAFTTAASDSYTNALGFITDDYKYIMHSTIGEFSPFHDNFLRKVSDYVSIASINDIFDNPKAIGEGNTINSYWVVKILNASAGELLNICSTLAAAAAATTAVSSATILRRIIDRRRKEILEKFEAEKNNNIVLVVSSASADVSSDEALDEIDAPVTQITDDINFWYGIENIGNSDYSQEEYLLDYMCAIKLPSETNISCPICIQPLSIWDSNTCKTQCGHTFHLQATSECSGLLKWCVSKGENSDCPICRTSIDISIDNL